MITEIIPEMFQLPTDNKLKIDTASMDLKDVGQIWATD